LNAHALKHGGKRRHLILQLGIGDGALRACDRAVVDQRSLIATGGHMPVDGVVAGVAERAGEPAAIGARGWVENRVGGLDPVDLPRGFLPKTYRIGRPARIDLMVAALGRQHGDFRCHYRMGLEWFDVVAGKRAVVTATFGEFP
jgi:hypothetical protein